MYDDDYEKRGFLENVTEQLPNSPRLIMLIGMPCTGKSTMANRLRATYTDYILISSDVIIEERAAAEGKNYNEVFASNIAEANRIVMDVAKLAVAEKKSVIWDQTNLSYFSRKNKLKLFTEDYFKMAYVFYPPENNEDYYKALANRPGKIIPAHAIGEMRKVFSPPAYPE